MVELPSCFLTVLVFLRLLCWLLVFFSGWNVEVAGAEVLAVFTVGNFLDAAELHFVVIA